ncbi:MAG TPA: DUF2844 domain-containing protein [Steroidobacteraceae bacterium]
MKYACPDRPPRSHLRLRLALGAAGMAVLLPAISLGGLGAAAASVEADSIQFHSNHAFRLTLAYTVHDLTLPNATTVREFVGSDGVVFAVSWQGPMLPDLRTLLGSHFQSLQSAPRSQPMAHSRLLLETPELVIRSEGHLRAFAGQAYLPQLLPAGVVVAELH